MESDIRFDFENGALGYWNRTDDRIELTPGHLEGAPWFYFLISDVKSRGLTFQTAPDTLPEETLATTPISVSYNRADWVPVDKKGPGGTFEHLFWANDATISLTPPYTTNMVYELSLWARRSPHVDIDYLDQVIYGLTCFTVTEMGQAGEKPVVWVVAREHAAEAGSSWLAEGMLRFLLSSDPDAKKLRKTYVFKIVPLLNIDAVRRRGGEAEPSDSEVSELTRRVLEPIDKTIVGGLTEKIIILRSTLNGTLSHASGIELSHVMPWYTVGNNTPYSPPGVLERELGERKDIPITQVTTAWYYPGQVLGTDNPVYKTTHELLQEGEMVCRALSQEESENGYPPLLLGSNVEVRDNVNDGVSVSVWMDETFAHDTQVILQGEGFTFPMHHVADYLNERSPYLRYTAEISFDQAQRLLSITAERIGLHRTLPLAWRRKPPGDISLV